MKFIRGIRNIPKELKRTAVTIGDFDGVHLGHQSIITRLVTEAKKNSLKSLLICFEPQPIEYFWKEQAQGRIMRLREKLTVFKKLKLDYLLCLAFNKKIADLSPDDFIKKILKEALDCKLWIIGDDFCCGKKRAGTPEVLHTLVKHHDIKMVQMKTFKIENERDSSTRIRGALKKGDFSLVERLMGRPYFLCGKVIHGDGRGKSLGYPTANIPLYHYKMAAQGIFVVKVYGAAKKSLYGLANLGIRPTFHDHGFVLEVYLLNFSGNLYGKSLYVEFLHKLRNEKRFNSIENLILQMDRDVEKAKSYLLSITSY